MHGMATHIANLEKNYLARLEDAESLKSTYLSVFGV